MIDSFILYEVAKVSSFWEWCQPGSRPKAYVSPAPVRTSESVGPAPSSFFQAEPKRSSICPKNSLYSNPQ